MNDKIEMLHQMKIENNDELDRTKHIKIWIALSFLVIVGSIVLWGQLDNAAIAVETTTVLPMQKKVHDNNKLLDAPGYVTARRRATVSSKITGKVDSVFIEEGMNVDAGQVLAVLDDKSVQRNIDLAEAFLATANASLNEAQVELDYALLNFHRADKLYKEGLGSQVSVDNARRLSENALLWQRFIFLRWQ